MAPVAPGALLVAALGGYLVPWALPEGLDRVERNPGAVADVFFFAGRLDAAGAPELTPVKGDWNEIADRVRRTGARVWLSMVNDRVPAAGQAVLKDADAVTAMLSDPAKRKAHGASIVRLAKSLAAHGVDLDYENLPASSKDRFTEFVRELAADLRVEGLALSVTVQPKSGEVSSRGPGAMDWPALCRIADRVQPMFYNEHNAATGPGPVASVAFVERVIRYGASVCPVGRVVPVLKVSGMDWGPRAAAWVTFKEAAARQGPARVRRDRRNKVPWFAYDGRDGRHVVYFEDVKSLEAKAATLSARGVSGLVLWSLGAEDPGVIPRLADQKR
jgi:spore germination protein YaaH